MDLRHLGRAGHQDGAERRKPARTRRAPRHQQAHERDVCAEQRDGEPASGVEGIDPEPGDRRDRDRVEGREARQRSVFDAIFRDRDAAPGAEIPRRLDVADRIRGDSDAVAGGMRQREHSGQGRERDEGGSHGAARELELHTAPRQESDYPSKG